jgi:hypothetical protein
VLTLLEILSIFIVNFQHRDKSALFYILVVHFVFLFISSLFILRLLPFCGELKIYLYLSHLYVVGRTPRFPTMHAPLSPIQQELIWSSWSTVLRPNALPDADPSSAFYDTRRNFLRFEILAHFAAAAVYKVVPVVDF